MSLLGTLEQLDLSLVLQRVERYAKTGLLQVKQEMQWVELYFQAGHLVCIGPVRTNMTLGERLRNDGVISTQALQETLLLLGPIQFSETRMALTLMDLGHVGHEELRGWFTRKATEVLQALLMWSSGEIYFEEDAVAPDRLLVSVSISSLLSAIPTYPRVSRSTQPLYNATSSGVLQAGQPGIADMSGPPTLTNPSQFLSGSSSTEMALPLTESSSPMFAGLRGENPASMSPPVRVSEPIQVQVPSTPK